MRIDGEMTGYWWAIGVARYASAAGGTPAARARGRRTVADRVRRMWADAAGDADAEAWADTWTRGARAGWAAAAAHLI